MGAHDGRSTLRARSRKETGERRCGFGLGVRGGPERRGWGFGFDTQGEDAAATTAAKRRGKKKGKNKGRRDGAPKLAASARADMALRHIRAEGEHRRGLYGDSGEYEH